MERREIERKIETIADLAFDRLYLAYHNRSDGGIIFPKYRNNELRVSEQEMRFAFVEELRRLYPEWRYSIETPTQEKYYFKDKTPRVDSEKGKSAQFDLTIYEGERILANIEFKAHNCPVKDMAKDFLKLTADRKDDPNIARVFIHLFDAFDTRTYNNVREKVEKCEGHQNVYRLYYLLQAYEGYNKRRIYL